MRKISKGPPCASKVLGALQHHGSGAGGAEHQDQMSKEEPGLQIQLERLLLHPFSRLPPGVRIAERGVAHGRSVVRLAGLGSVAAGAFSCRAGLLAVGLCGLFKEAKALRRVGATDGLRVEHSAQSQVTDARVAGSVKATALWTWTLHFR